MSPHIITLLFLLLALVLYYVGMSLPATIFLVLGGIAEIVFWVRLFRGDNRDSDRRETT